jgi:hypothetical protein
MYKEKFFWNKDRTEIFRAGAIKQITIEELEGVQRKVAGAPEGGRWLVRASFIHGAGSSVLGNFNTPEEARGYVEQIQRRVESA